MFGVAIGFSGALAMFVLLIRLNTVGVPRFPLQLTSQKVEDRVAVAKDDTISQKLSIPQYVRVAWRCLV